MELELPSPNDESNIRYRSGKNDFSRNTSAVNKSRQESCWFQFWNVSFTFGSRLFLLPYVFLYDSERDLYKLEATIFQKWVWLLLQFSGLLVMRVRILEGWDYVKTSDEMLRYFDFGFLIVVYCFDTTFKLILWNNLDRLRDFLNELQDSPILVVSSSKSFKIRFFMLAFSIAYLIPSFFYFCLTWGIDTFDPNLFYEAVKSQAMATFSLNETWVSTPYFPIIMALSFCINQYQASFWHFNDIYVLSSIFLMFTLAQDFSRALINEVYSPSQVLRFMKSYKILIIKYNEALGVATCVYSLYCSPYYAAHLIDMLSLPDFLNRFSMAVYIGFLALGLAAAVELNTMAKQMKRWLTIDDRYLNRMEIQNLSIFLDDLRNTKFGLGSFFVIHHGLAGQIVNLILTLAIITIQMRINA